MTLVIYSAPYSTCTCLIALVCKEKQIPFNFHPIDLVKGKHKTPDFLASQPFGQIPYVVILDPSLQIDDDGFVLYKARAIAHYLIKKFPNQGTQYLIPTNPKEEALFEQAALIKAFNFNPFTSIIAQEKLFKLQSDVLVCSLMSKQVIQECLIMLNTKLDTYDVILGKQKYLASNKVTLADLQHLPYGTALVKAGYGELDSSRPNVARWWNDLTNRPAWQDILEIFK